MNPQRPQKSDSVDDCQNQLQLYSTAIGYPESSNDQTRIYTNILQPIFFTSIESLESLTNIQKLYQRFDGMKQRRQNKGKYLGEKKKIKRNQINEGICEVIGIDCQEYNNENKQCIQKSASHHRRYSDQIVEQLSQNSLINKQSLLQTQQTSENTTQYQNEYHPLQVHKINISSDLLQEYQKIIYSQSNNEDSIDFNKKRQQFLKTSRVSAKSHKRKSGQKNKKSAKSKRSSQSLRKSRRKQSSQSQRSSQSQLSDYNDEQIFQKLKQSAVRQYQAKVQEQIKQKLLESLKCHHENQQKAYNHNQNPSKSPIKNHRGKQLSPKYKQIRTQTLNRTENSQSILFSSSRSQRKHLHQERSQNKSERTYYQLNIFYNKQNLSQESQTVIKKFITRILPLQLKRLIIAINIKVNNRLGQRFITECIQKGFDNHTTSRGYHAKDNLLSLSYVNFGSRVNKNDIIEKDFNTFWMYGQRNNKQRKGFAIKSVREELMSVDEMMILIEKYEIKNIEINFRPNMDIGLGRFSKLKPQKSHEGLINPFLLNQYKKYKHSEDINLSQQIIKHYSKNDLKLRNKIKSIQSSSNRLQISQLSKSLRKKFTKMQYLKMSVQDVQRQNYENLQEKENISQQSLQQAKQGQSNQQRRNRLILRFKPIKSLIDQRVYQNLLGVSLSHFVIGEKDGVYVLFCKFLKCLKKLKTIQIVNCTFLVQDNHRNKDEKNQYPYFFLNYLPNKPLINTINLSGTDGYSSSSHSNQFISIAQFTNLQVFIYDIQPEPEQSKAPSLNNSKPLVSFYKLLFFPENKLLNKLSYLNLYGHKQINNQSLRGLVGVCSSCRLKSLNLGYTSIRSPTIKDTTKGTLKIKPLQLILTKLKNLQQLNIDYTKINLSQLIRFPSKNKISLKKLSVQGFSLRQNGFEFDKKMFYSLINKLEELDYLVIKYCNGVRLLDYEEFLEVIREREEMRREKGKIEDLQKDQSNSISKKKEHNQINLFPVQQQSGNSDLRKKKVEGKADLNCMGQGQIIKRKFTILINQNLYGKLLYTTSTKTHKKTNPTINKNQLILNQYINWLIDYKSDDEEQESYGYSQYRKQIQSNNQEELDEEQDQHQHEHQIGNNNNNFYGQGVIQERSDEEEQDIIDQRQQIRQQMQKQLKYTPKKRIRPRFQQQYQKQLSHPSRQLQIQRIRKKIKPNQQFDLSLSHIQSSKQSASSSLLQILCQEVYKEISLTQKSFLEQPSKKISNSGDCEQRRSLQVLEDKQRSLKVSKQSKQLLVQQRQVQQRALQSQVQQQQQQHIQVPQSQPQPQLQPQPQPQSQNPQPQFQQQQEAYNQTPPSPIIFQQQTPIPSFQQQQLPPSSNNQTLCQKEIQHQTQKQIKQIATENTQQLLQSQQQLQKQQQLQSQYHQKQCEQRVLIWGQNRNRDNNKNDNGIMIDDNDDVQQGELVIIGYKSSRYVMGVIRQKQEEYLEDQDEEQGENECGNN